MSGKLPAQTPPRVPVERKKRSCSECRRRKQKCDQKRPCRHCARRVPQPICEYENNPYVVSIRMPTIPRVAGRDLISGLRFADRRRHPRRIPSQVPDFAGLPNPTQTTQPGPSFVPVPFIPGQPDSWNRSSISSSISGSSTAELSWDPALFQQYPEPYPPSLPVDNTTAPDLGPYMNNNFLSFATEGPLLLQPSFFVETCMLSTETPTNRETTLLARYNAVNALQERINNPLLFTSDETIAQAIKLASNDLCYGEIHELRVHIHRIQEMTRLRGGLQSLGMNGTLANMAIIIDRIIAIALEIVSTYTSSEVSSYISPGPIPSPPPPSSLEPATAALLKDVTFLLDTVLALPPSPSEWELQKLSSMSKWVYGRLTPPSPSQTSSSSSSLSSSSASALSSLHQSIRLASLIYCRAIQVRKPLSQVVSHQDIFELTDAVWKVPLETWNDAQGGLLSTLIWVLVGILPVAKGMQGVYTTKTMIMAAAVQLAMVPGTVGQGGDGVLDVLERVVRLQRWLEGGNGQAMPAVSGTSISRGGSGSPGV